MKSLKNSYKVKAIYLLKKGQRTYSLPSHGFSYHVPIYVYISTIHGQVRLVRLQANNFRFPFETAAYIYIDIDTVYRYICK